MRVYLADLGHNQQTLSSDVFPLGVANLATYAAAALADVPIEFRIFREPEDLQSALDAAPPDILGLSSYSWNHRLSRFYARYARARRADTLTIMGGPNFPLTVEEQESFLRSMPEIDVAVRGPTYEGERAFTRLVERFHQVGARRDGIFEAPIDGNLWIDPSTGDFVRGGEVDRILDLDEIPSPYLAGLMDPFFDTGYFPLLQISRGCPFSCTFCNSSVRSNNKIYSHSIENVKADLTYIAERVRHELPVCFADDNFGMYPPDEEIADYIAWLQDRHGWPRYIRTTTGKNRSERIIRVMRKVRGALPMTAAVQSMNPVVLKNIKRSNVKLETYKEIQQEVLRQGMQSYGELIICLPGETRETFLGSVHDLLEAGCKRISAHQLMLLHGAPLSNPESRELHGFDTRFRVVARNIGRYADRPVVEVEEMVVETPTFSFDDYLDMRVFHLLLTIFYYEGNFEEPFEFARSYGVKPFDIVMTMQALLDEAPPAFRRVIADFLQESELELFDTREACIEWAESHYEQLVDGTLGGNLLSKYSMMGRFYVMREAVEFLGHSVRAAIGEGLEPEGAEALDALLDYLGGVLLDSPFARSVDAQPSWRSRYDVARWIDEGYLRPLAHYRLPRATEYTTSIEPERRDLILSRIGTFGEHPSQLGKFTRTMFARDLRRTVQRSQPVTEIGAVR